jgi:hypothetical protein
LKKSLSLLGVAGNYLMLVGGGLGFMAANFLTRNNRLDKAAVTYLLALALISLLSRGKEGLLFVAVKLAYKDLTSFLKRARPLSDAQVYVLVPAFVLGLLLNTFFALVKVDNGGYLWGAALLVAGLLLVSFGRKGAEPHQS